MAHELDVGVAHRCSARVGEGPFWDAATGTLSWVDILSGRIYTAPPEPGGIRVITLPTLVGAALPRAGGGFVAATAEGFAEVGADGSWSTRVSLLPDGQRMNDAKCDPAGRLWAGSTDLEFAAGCGAVHVLTPDWRSEQVLTGLSLPNGLGWSPDGRRFYLIDSITRELFAFDTDTDTDTDTDGPPELTNRRLLATFPGAGLPDGLTVDTDGCLWIAMWGAARVLRASPEGDVLREVPMPAEQPSSCTFGGPGHDVLYVTSAREDLVLPEDDVAGSVFAVRGLGVTGLPDVRFAG